MDLPVARFRCMDGIQTAAEDTATMTARLSARWIDRFEGFVRGWARVSRDVLT